MTKENNPAQFWRKKAHGGSGLAKNDDSKSSFRKRYDELLNSIGDEVNENYGLDFRYLIYAGIGLLTYGEIDVAYNIVKYAPEIRQDEGIITRWMCRAIVNLLPLEGDLADDAYIRRNKDEFYAWLDNNKDKLIWSSEEGKFLILKNNSST